MLGGLWGRWNTGNGSPPEVEHPRGRIVDNPWMRSGVYTLRALGPFDRFELKARLTSMLGAELLAVAHDLMVMAATAEEGPSRASFAKIYASLRAYAGRGEPVERKVIADAAGELWGDMLRRMYALMPDERELDMTDFLGKTRPYFAALGPIMAQINAQEMMEIVKHMLIVRPNNAAGLYVRDLPCKDRATIDAVVPHDDLPAIAFWALLFNIRPFSRAGASTGNSPGQHPPAPSSTARTPSQRGPATGSSTSTAGPRPRSRT